MTASFTEPAKKHLGQNFLHDRGVIDKIVQAIDPKPGDAVVEIGPGQGALTFPLLKRHGAITAIEFDRDLHAPLQAAARDHGALHLIEGDVLGVDFSALAAELAPAGGKIRLAGNLPYNLSSPILFHALDHAQAIRDMHFMLQKEVVERMAAGPGSKVYGRLRCSWCRRARFALRRRWIRRWCDSFRSPPSRSWWQIAASSPTWCVPRSGSGARHCATR